MCFILYSNLVILGTLVCLVVITVSAASAALLSCRVRCPYYYIFHLLMANKTMMTMMKMTMFSYPYVMFGIPVGVTSLEFPQDIWRIMKNTISLSVGYI